MDQIKLGSGRKKQDFQYAREVQKHLNSIAGKEGTKSMVNYPAESKSNADAWPHQCRYYKSCTEIVQNPTQNYGHFKRIHPWTDDEKYFLLKLFEESPTGKTVYMLSILYGRSESELKLFFKSQHPNIPKWGKKTVEVGEVQQLLQTQMTTIRSNNKIKVSQTKESDAEEITWDEVEIISEPIPTNVTTIQAQNYLLPPDQLGSGDFYKNLVDALFEKHKSWVSREEHLKNKVIELENKIDELKIKLIESFSETKIEDVAEYNEQINQIYQGF